MVAVTITLLIIEILTLYHLTIWKMSEILNLLDSNPFLESFFFEDNDKRENCGLNL